MFDESLVVQSAVSAFNNAALVAPTFFWIGLLAAPLLAFAYFYGGDFMRRIGWRKDDMVKNSCVLTIALTLLWLVLFGGNYGVLRDAASVLPFGIAAVVFACGGVLGDASRGVSLPRWRGLGGRRRVLLAAGVAAVLFVVGNSGVHTWWGAALQIGAFCGGLAFGRWGKRMTQPMTGCLAVVAATSTLMLMQPEFFRFGQLGALGFLHLAALLITIAAISATVALRWGRPRGRIHRSAYVKLKWMMRFVTALAVVLFLLTESVPVFLGAAVSMLIMFTMSVWHADRVPDTLWVNMLAVVLGAFGLMATLPVVSALGVMIWAANPAPDFFRDIKFLL